MLGVTVALLAALTVYTRRAVERFARAESGRASLIYAAPQQLAPGVNVRAIDLERTLARLDYVEVEGDPVEPGQYRRSPDAWEIHLRERRGSIAVEPPHRVKLELRGERIASIQSSGKPVVREALEGEVLTSAGDEAGDEHRPVRLADVPRSLVDAVIAIEDNRFYEHSGLDLRGLLRALWVNTREGRVAQGGSTITQQLVKNRLLSAERTLSRKISEAWLALVLEWSYPKETLLEAYLNEVYLGQRGSLAIRGMGAASRAYFDKEAHELTLSESALLAGMIRAPNTYSPALDPLRAKERRDLTLSRMLERGTIDAAEMESAQNEPVRAENVRSSGQLAPYFSDHVRRQLEATLGTLAPGAGGAARIYTTLDVPLQRFAEAAVVRGLERIERDFPRLRRETASERVQAALVALDVATGEVLALVGGRDYRTTQFNRVTLAHRQPGSAFKPFVFLAALTDDATTEPFTLASFVEDEPITLEVGTKSWSPRNHDDLYEGRVTLRRALEGSLNAATVRVAESVGLEAVVRTARRLGITSELAEVPAMALGAFEVSPLELARAYLPLANGGRRLETPIVVRAAYDETGAVLAIGHATAEPVISPAAAYLMTSVLSGVVDRGTAASVRAAGLSADVAGKTGTTNEGRDAWFVGYSSQMLALVWVGFDDGTPHGLSASQVAVPIWTEFMKQAVDAYPSPDFDIPEGITSLQVDLTNGYAANRYCPANRAEYFLAGTEPPPCSEHTSSMDRAFDHAIDAWDRLRNWLQR